MEEKVLKKFFWTEAATAGLILGAAMFVFSFVVYYFNLAFSYSTLLSVFQAVIITSAMVISGRRVAEFRGERRGFSYGQSMSFILAMMIFTGIIYGLGEFFLQVVIDPEYFNNLYEMAINKSNADSEFINKAIAAREDIQQIIKNPAVMVISGIFSMLLYGGILGLVVSAFIKKSAVHTNIEE